MCVCVLIIFVVLCLSVPIDFVVDRFDVARQVNVGSVDSLIIKPIVVNLHLILDGWAEMLLMCCYSSVSVYQPKANLKETELTDCVVMIIDAFRYLFNHFLN